MSTVPQRVRVPTPSGDRRVGRLLDAAWKPTYNDQDHDELLVDVDGTTLRVRADEVEPANDAPDR